MTPLRSLVLFLLVAAASGAAFVPTHSKQSLSTTARPMKFLKDLGFEKPSWLPDFGGDKEEKEEEKPEETEEEESTEEGKAAAASED